MIFPTQKVWLTGVESTGKSTLAAALAQRCDSLWVREYARIYLDALPRDYTQTDIDHIAAGQLRAVEQQLPKANQYLFCDTGMLVLKIWSMHKYGNCSSFIVHQLHRQHGDCHLLCSPKGVKWEYDPLRETPNL
ncbi:MAG: ATP-binding protein, partial [Bacteroidota bacterium]